MILKKQQKGCHSGSSVPLDDGRLHLPLADEISISYLIIQHKKEMLDQNLSLQTVVKETLDAEFLKMLQGCIFVPFLHEETPQKTVIPMDSTPADKWSFVPNPDEANFMLSVR